MLSKIVYALLGISFLGLLISVDLPIREVKQMWIIAEQPLNNASGYTMSDVVVYHPISQLAEMFSYCLISSLAFMILLEALGTNRLKSKQVTLLGSQVVTPA